VILHEEESDWLATVGAPEEYEPERRSRPGRDRCPDEIACPKAALPDPRQESGDRDRRQPDAEQALQPEGRSGGDGRGREERASAGSPGEEEERQCEAVALAAAVSVFRSAPSTSIPAPWRG